MPTYTYECTEHGQFDCIMPISQMERSMPCPECGKVSRKIITLGHGGIQRSDPEWVRGVSKFFEVDGHKRMETIDDLRTFYKENPTIRPYESHPALPSALGDVKRPPPDRERYAKVKKEAMEFVRKDNAISLTSRTSA